MRTSLTNILLLLIAAFIALDVALNVGHGAKAASAIRVQTISKPGTVDVSGEVVGFACVNKGAYTECSIASR